MYLQFKGGYEIENDKNIPKYVDAYVNFYYYFLYVELQTSILPPLPSHVTTFHLKLSLAFPPALTVRRLTRDIRQRYNRYFHLTQMNVFSPLQFSATIVVFYFKWWRAEEKNANHRHVYVVKIKKM